MYGVIYWDRLNYTAPPRYLTNIDGSIMIFNSLDEAEQTANAYEASTGNEACVVNLECVKA